MKGFLKHKGKEKISVQVTVTVEKVKGLPKSSSPKQLIVDWRRGNLKKMAANFIPVE
jgi:hypothetical protein